jgi:adenosylcobalamin-dependent ribonucleoside-triphosphate reductase
MYLSDAFVDKYKNVVPPFGGNGLGHFVATRTYKRWDEEHARREKWYEVVRRVVEYSMSLYQGSAQFEELKIEAELLFDHLFNLKMFVAGRTMWIGGTEASKKFPEANYNCSFTIIDSFDTFGDIFYLLLCGVGTGFRVLPDDVNKLPPVNTKIVIAHKPYHPKPKNERLQETQIYEEDGSVYIIVADSKEGWVEAIRKYFTTIQRTDIESIMINYDSVRPKGEILKTFGGRASGHQSLREMFRNIHKIIKQSNGALKPIDCMDISNIIAMNTVVGGKLIASYVTKNSLNSVEVSLLR